MQSACAVLYSHLWPLCLHPIFRHNLIKGMIFGKKVTEHKTFVSISLQLFMSRSKKNSERYCYKCENVFTHSTRHFFRILMKLEFSLHVFGGKSSDINFNKTHPLGVESFHTDKEMKGWTDGHDKANTRFSQFYKLA